MQRVIGHSVSRLILDRATSSGQSFGFPIGVLPRHSFVRAQSHWSKTQALSHRLLPTTLYIISPFLRSHATLTSDFTSTPTSDSPHQQSFSHTMAKRIVEDSSDSALSTPPSETESAAVSVKSTVKGKKRKAETTVTKTKRVKKASIQTEEELKLEESQNGKKVKVTVTKRQKKGGDPEAPLEERTVGTKLLVGAHVSSAGGVQNTITNLLHIGANAFALFLKSQRKWQNPDLDPTHAKLFIDGCTKHGIQPGKCCLPHGSYLVNLAHPDPVRKDQAYTSFHDDLTRCHKLGIKLYNFHPGNSNASPTRQDGIKTIAENINRAHKDPKTGEVIAVLETMATLGNTIGGTFQDIADIIKHVEDKTRVGVCIDTCHVFAAGYDLRTPEAYAKTMKEFDEIIGLKYLKALHINDSKAPLQSNRDLHARIGTGYLGLRSFHNLVNDERLHGLPMVLETPIDVVGADGKKIEDKTIWAREIKLLEKLVEMDADSKEFKNLEAELWAQGTGERERIGDQVKRKKAKDASPKKSRKIKKKVEIDEGDDSSS